MSTFHKIAPDEIKKDYERVDNLGENRIEETFAGQKLKAVWLRKRSDDWNQAKGVGIAPQSRIMFEFESGRFLVITCRNESDHLYDIYYEDGKGEKCGCAGCRISLHNVEVSGSRTRDPLDRLVVADSL